MLFKKILIVSTALLFTCVYDLSLPASSDLFNFDLSLSEVDKVFLVKSPIDYMYICVEYRNVAQWISLELFTSKSLFLGNIPR